MSHPIIENYLTISNNKWIHYCEHQCIICGINRGDHEDILQNIMLRYFAAHDEQSVINMITTIVHHKYSLLDIYLFRAIKNQVLCYRRNTHRRENVVKHVSENFDIDWFRMPEPENYDQFDLYEAQQKASAIIKNLDISPAVRYLLNGVIVENMPYRQLKCIINNKSLGYHDGLHALKMAAYKMDNRPTDALLFEYAPYARVRMSDILACLSIEDKETIAQKVKCPRSFVENVLRATQKQTTHKAMVIIAEAKAKAQRYRETINKVDPDILNGGGNKLAQLIRSAAKEVAAKNRITPIKRPKRLTSILNKLKKGDQVEVAGCINETKTYVWGVLNGKIAQDTSRAIRVIAAFKDKVKQNK